MHRNVATVGAASLHNMDATANEKQQNFQELYV